MSLSCSVNDDYSDCDWYWTVNSFNTQTPLSTKRSRKCCSCKKKINVGELSTRIYRYRPPSERCNYIEESIYGDEVPLASWYLCEECGDLASSLDELGFCFSLGDTSIKQQLDEYRAEEKQWRHRKETA